MAKGIVLPFQRIERTILVTAPASPAGDTFPLAYVLTRTITVLPSTPDFSIAVGPSERTVNAGGLTTYTVTVRPVSGFAGTVNLSVGSQSGFPTGIASGGFSRPSIVGSGSSTMTIDTTPNAIPYALTLTVTGTSGTITHAASTTLIVNMAPPASLTVTSGNAQVSLAWPASAGASFYQAKRSSFAGGPYQTLACIADTSYVDVNVTNGSTYRYVIDAGYVGGPNSGGESADSHEAKATPRAR